MKPMLLLAVSFSSVISISSAAHARIGHSCINHDYRGPNVVTAAYQVKVHDAIQVFYAQEQTYNQWLAGLDGHAACISNIHYQLYWMHSRLTQMSNSIAFVDAVVGEPTRSANSHVIRRLCNLAWDEYGCGAEFRQQLGAAWDTFGAAQDALLDALGHHPGEASGGPGDDNGE